MLQKVVIIKKSEEIRKHEIRKSFRTSKRDKALSYDNKYTFMNIDWHYLHWKSSKKRLNQGWKGMNGFVVVEITWIFMNQSYEQYTC